MTGRVRTRDGNTLPRKDLRQLLENALKPKNTSTKASKPSKALPEKKPEVLLKERVEPVGQVVVPSDLLMPSLGELLELPIPERQHILKPWLREHESCLLYAATGLGNHCSRSQQRWQCLSGLNEAD